MNKKKVPVILLAFADERDGRRLEQLPHERRKLEAALEPLEDADVCKLVVESNATWEDIKRRVVQYGTRIAIFHYAGHASPDTLDMEGEDGGTESIGATGFARLLSGRGCHPPKLVFLNGCSSAEQSKELLEQGVGAVIGTTDSIEDEVATGFAGLFYQRLAQQGTIAESFDMAEDYYDGKFKHKSNAYRNVAFEDEGQPDPDTWPWTLYTRETQAKAARGWTIGMVETEGEDHESHHTRLLGYMCDRHPQTGELLEKLLPEHDAESNNRPLGLILHGERDEAHAKFIRRLEVWDLPRYLESSSGIQPLVRHISIDWGRNSETMKRDFAERLAGRGEASIDEIRTAFADSRSPLLVSTTIGSKEWSKDTPARITDWLKHIGSLGQLPGGQILLAVVAIVEDSETSKGFLSSWKSTPTRFVSKFTSPEGIYAEALPRLESVPKHEVTEEWLDKKSEFEAQVKELLDELPASAREGVIIEINAYVHELYKDSDVLSMRVLGDGLARQIHKVIKEAR